MSTETLLTVKDLCGRWKVSKDFLYKHIREETGPAFVRLAGEIRYRLRDIQNYEESNVIATENSK